MTAMEDIKRIEVDEFWANSTVVEAGGFVFVGYCMRNEGQDIRAQIAGAFDVLEERLAMAGLTLGDVVKMDCLFRDIQDIHCLADIIREKFPGRYPARKAFETRFLREGILFQVDAIACKPTAP